MEVDVVRRGRVRAARARKRDSIVLLLGKAFS